VGYDAAKKVKGRKRHAVVDTLGLMLGCAILPGNVQDRDGCLGVLTAVRRLFPFLERVIADGAYQGRETARAVRRAARARLEIVKRSDAAKGFVVLQKRWIVERPFGWLGRCRRLAKDFEALTRTHLAFVQLAMIRVMHGTRLFYELLSCGEPCRRMGRGGWPAMRSRHQWMASPCAARRIFLSRSKPTRKID
jgi:transposase